MLVQESPVIRIIGRRSQSARGQSKGPSRDPGSPGEPQPLGNRECTAWKVGVPPIVRAGSLVAGPVDGSLVELQRY